MKKTLLIVLFITGVCLGQTYQLAEEFYENGLPKVIKTYKESNDKFELIISISVYENGQKEKEVTFKDGKSDGLLTWWHENGQKGKEVTYKDGEIDGLLTEWYENGQKESEATWKDDELDGKKTNWYENGEKKEEMTFKDGERNGLYTYWRKNGQKGMEITFIDGKWISEQCWDEAGNEKECN